MRLEFRTRVLYVELDHLVIAVINESVTELRSVKSVCDGFDGNCKVHARLDDRAPAEGELVSVRCPCESERRAGRRRPLVPGAVRCFGRDH